ncbi:MAG: hypothetical protein R3208_10790 [Ketobacteraceae bacterium]|nr:hypothetical protein [Ketobacteraceae bacterium]
MKPQILAAAMSALLLAGCSSMPSMPSLGEPDPIISNLMGKPVTFVEGRLGLPNRRTDSPSGSMVWTYLDNEKGATAKACEVSLSIRDGVVEHVYISRQNKSLMSFVTSACDRIREEVIAKS